MKSYISVCWNGWFHLLLLISMSICTATFDLTNPLEKTSADEFPEYVDLLVDLLKWHCDHKLPTGLKLLDKSDRSIEIAWTPPYDENSTVTRYRVEYKLKGCGYNNKKYLLIPGNQSSAVITGLYPATIYDLRIWARFEDRHTYPSDDFTFKTKEKENQATTATTTDPPEATTTDPSEATTTDPPEATTADPPEATTTDPPEATTTDPPEATTTDPPEATTTDPPEATTTEPPEATTTESPPFTENKSKPVVLDVIPKKTVTLGIREVTLPCSVDTVDNFQHRLDHKIYWFFKKQSTDPKVTYPIWNQRNLLFGPNIRTNDARFSLEQRHVDKHWEWNLKLRYVNLLDQGLYTCSVDSVINQTVFLEVKAPIVDISDEGGAFFHQKFYKTGSMVEIKCTISQRPQADTFLKWYHDGRMLNYDTSRGGISVRTYIINNSVMVSRLFIKNATLNDSGNYTCSLDRMVSGSVQVHIINDKLPVSLRLGSSITGETITEGMDVYFECDVSSNFNANNISWVKNGTYKVDQDQMTGVLVSGKHLVLQHLQRTSAGNYTCVAFNAQGSATSNVVPLTINSQPVVEKGLPIANGRSFHIWAPVGEGNNKVKKDEIWFMTPTHGTKIIMQAKLCSDCKLSPIVAVEGASFYEIRQQNKWQKIQIKFTSRYGASTLLIGPDSRYFYAKNFNRYKEEFADYLTFNSTSAVYWSLLDPDKEPCCNYPWQVVGSDCLLIEESELLTWSEARDTCKRLNGYLAEPTDFQLLIAFISKNHHFEVESGKYLLGASDIETEDVWRYNMSGQLVPNHVWGSGEPNNWEEQDCMCLWNSKKHGAIVSDTWCDQQYKYVCQKGSGT